MPSTYDPWAIAGQEPQAPEVTAKEIDLYKRGILHKAESRREMIDALFASYGVIWIDFKTSWKRAKWEFIGRDAHRAIDEGREIEYIWIDDSVTISLDSYSAHLYKLRKEEKPPKRYESRAWVEMKRHSRGVRK